MRKIHTLKAGLFWYTDAHQYAEFLRIYEDADNLHETFSEWHKDALKILAHLKHRGYYVERIYSTPQEFKTWCIVNDAPLNGESRSKFASFKGESSEER